MLHKLLSSTDTLKLKSKKKKKYCKAGPGSQGTRKTELVESGIFLSHSITRPITNGPRARGKFLALCSGECRTAWTGPGMVPAPILGNFAYLVSTCRTKGGCLCGICLCPRTLLNPALRLSQSKLPASSWCFSQCLPPKLSPLVAGTHQQPCRLGLSQSSLPSPQGIDCLGPLRLSLLPPSKTLSQTTPDMSIMCAWCNVIWRTLHHLTSSLSKNIEPESKGVFTSNHWLAENMGAGRIR